MAVVKGPRRRIRVVAALVVGLCSLAAAAVVAVTLALLPADRGHDEASPLPAHEHEATIAALRPPKRVRPLVVVLAHNDGTETTDFLVPFGVLAASGRADVVAVALRDGPVTLMPALTVRATMTTADFDIRYPDGADYVIVPAMHTSDDPDMVSWIRKQAGAHAIVVGICEGAWVLGAAGLLDGRAATTHWFWAGRFRSAHPSVRWVSDRRYVVDRGVMTTTGVSASIPASLAIVEAIAGREAAAGLAGRFGIASWDESHASAPFRVDRPAARTTLRNFVEFWNWETVSIPLVDGVDEVALAVTADGYARTFRTTVRTSKDKGTSAVTRGGLTVLADGSGPPGGKQLEVPAEGNAMTATLRAIARRYGDATADFVALQLEYAR